MGIARRCRMTKTDFELQVARTGAMAPRMLGLLARLDRSNMGPVPLGAPKLNVGSGAAPPARFRPEKAAPKFAAACCASAGASSFFSPVFLRPCREGGATGRHIEGQVHAGRGAVRDATVQLGWRTMML